MSEETTEVFRMMDEERKRGRQHNTTSSTQLLREQGIPFVSKNGGAHLIVDGVADFWPSTGLFKPRDPKYGKDRGVMWLLKYVRARQLDRQRATVTKSE